MKEFKFNTRYDLGDKVVGFDSFNNKLVEFEVTEISFEVTSRGVAIWYRGHSALFREPNVYRTKKEFIDSL